jgi:isopentenyl-diphosphate delta-isomerase
MPAADIRAQAKMRKPPRSGGLTRIWVSTCPLESLGTIRYRAELDHGMIEHELVHMFRGLYDGPIAPNPAEAEGYQWARLDDVRADVAAMPQRFSAWFGKYIAAQWPVALAAPTKASHSQA